MPRSMPEVGDRVPEAETVAALAFAAFESQDWRTLVELTDVASVATHQALHFEALRLRLPVSEPEPREVEPDAMAALELMQTIARMFGADKPADLGLAGIHSLQEAEALDASEFLVRWAQARHPSYLSAGDKTRHWSGSFARRVVVGSVAVVPNKVAVMVRRTDMEDSVWAHSLIAMIDRGVGWRLDATCRWLGLD